MELVIKIPEEMYKWVNDANKFFADYGIGDFIDLIKNGTPLEKHDEEVIEETVESIWGKPPYTELLDKIKIEIKALSPEPTAYDVVDGNPIKDAVWEIIADVLKIIDKYKAEGEK